MTIIDSLRHLIVLAPLAGGPSTPELAAAVNEAGGFGFLAGGYLNADALAQRIARLRELSDKPYGVNLFVPSAPTDPAVFASYVETVTAEAAAAGLPVGEPTYTDDAWDAKLDLLIADAPAVVSFTFDCPSPDVIARVKAAGSEAWVTVTNPDEAEIARAAGADAVALQGGEAGGHRGTFVNSADMPTYGVLALIQLTADLGVPRIAAGGIMTREAVAAVITAGASAAAMGTAFLLCPEAGTPQVHRDAFGSGRPTRLTQSFSGRMARGIVNEFMARHDDESVAAYPEINSLTSPLRNAARERGQSEWINLWAGQGYSLARAIPAADVVRGLSPRRE